MAIHYTIQHACPLKDQLGGETGLAAQLRLYGAVAAARAANDGPGEAGEASGSSNATETAVQWLRHATGTVQTLTLPAAREQLADLDALANEHCVDCNANRYRPDAPAGMPPRPSGTGCSGTLPLPISEAAETYIADLLAAALAESARGSHDLRLLLLEQLRGSPTKGLASAALRQSDRGAQFFELRRAKRVGRGGFLRRVRFTTDQVFERTILERKLPDGMCLFLAAFSGGIRVQPVPPDGDVRAMQPGDGVPWTLIHPDNPSRPDVLWTFEMPEPPRGTADDPCVRAFRSFFRSCFHAWTLKCDMVLEVAAPPPPAS